VRRQAASASILAQRQLGLFRLNEDSINSSVTLRMRNLPRPHTVRLLAVGFAALRMAQRSNPDMMRNAYAAGE
jgi:hypothetical protein